MTTDTIRRVRVKGRSNVVFKCSEREKFIAWFELLRVAGRKKERICRISEKWPFPPKNVQEELKRVFRSGWPFIPVFDEKKKVVRIRRR